MDELVEAIPYKVNVVLTDNGIQFADLPRTAQDGPQLGAAIPSIEAARGTASSVA